MYALRLFTATLFLALVLAMQRRALVPVAGFFLVSLAVFLVGRLHARRLRRLGFGTAILDIAFFCGLNMFTLHGTQIDEVRARLLLLPAWSSSCSSGSSACSVVSSSPRPSSPSSRSASCSRGWARGGRSRARCSSSPSRGRWGGSSSAGSSGSSTRWRASRSRASGSGATSRRPSPTASPRTARRAPRASTAR